MFVIIGRETFSAAQDFSNFIERVTNATFVGEPSGSSPIFVGESTAVVLPWSGLSFTISSRYWQDSHDGDDRPFICPDGSSRAPRIRVRPEISVLFRRAIGVAGEARRRRQPGWFPRRCNNASGGEGRRNGTVISGRALTSRARTPRSARSSSLQRLRRVRSRAVSPASRERSPAASSSWGRSRRTRFPTRGLDPGPRKQGLDPRTSIRELFASLPSEWMSL